MAKIVGKLKPEDDYTHPLGPEPNFNESMYFNFFDRVHRLGGFVRIGNRANEHRAEMTVAIFLPNGGALFNFKRPAIRDNDGFDAGGMKFEVIEPTEVLRSVYRGTVIELADPHAMADPRKAFAENPTKQLTLELLHRAVGPMYGNSRDDDEVALSQEDQFAAAHYEQHMRVTGALEVDGRRFEIDGFGLRDHSWGPRSWQAIHSYEWLTMNFGEDFGAMVSIVRRSADSERIGGVVVRGEEADFVTAASIAPEYEENGLYHKALTVRLQTRGGQDLEITGKVGSFIPLRNRREGRTTHVGEGMTEWRCGERTGFGLAEFLRQIS